MIGKNIQYLHFDFARVKLLVDVADEFDEAL